MSSATEIVLKFIERINRQDVEGLADLMSEDHVFLDSVGGRGEGRENMRRGWAEYFRMMSDFRIEVEMTIAEEDRVAVVGTASGTYVIDGKVSRENYWKCPAAWLAVVKDELLAEWRVFADLKPLYQIIDRSRKE